MLHTFFLTLSSADELLVVLKSERVYGFKPYVRRPDVHLGGPNACPHAGVSWLGVLLFLKGAELPTLLTIVR